MKLFKVVLVFINNYLLMKTVFKINILFIVPSQKQENIECKCHVQNDKIWTEKNCVVWILNTVKTIWFINAMQIIKLTSDIIW